MCGEHVDQRSGEGEGKGVTMRERERNIEIGRARKEAVR